MVYRKLLELDWESIVVGLLHDTVEDTNLLLTTCNYNCYDFVAWVVCVKLETGVIQMSKLGKLKYKNESHSVQDVKAHDLRQMFLAMTEEMATVNGAKVILWDNEIGSLKVGKKVGWGKDELGNYVAIDLESGENHSLNPLGHKYFKLVYYSLFTRVVRQEEGCKEEIVVALAEVVTTRDFPFNKLAVSV
ncbi:hypothetical protein Tco_1438544 [Tanacetum coccineum]